MDSEDTTYPIPKQLKNYSIGTIKGRGAYGTVYEATHVNEEKVAIKVFNKMKLAQNPDDLAMINSEIQLLKKLYHKNILRLYEIFEDALYIYVVTELCERGELFDYILLKQTLGEDEALTIFQEIVDALIYLHIEMEVCHRDLKPENILLTECGKTRTIKLIDFGYGKKYDDQSLLSEPLGTPPYACPEIHMNSEYHGASADIWSAGVVLYVMVCGYLPFGEDGDAEERISQLIINGEYTLPENTLSPLLIDFIKHLLEVDPCQRYDFEQITQHAWFNSKAPILTGGINIDIVTYPIDERILDLCVEHGFNKEEVRKLIHSNAFNEKTAIYKMKLSKMIRENCPSRSDLFSQEFMDYIEDNHNKANQNENEDEELIKQNKSPSGHIIAKETSLTIIRNDSFNFSTGKSIVCPGCGRQIKSSKNSNTNSKFVFVSIDHADTFSISKELKGLEETSVIHLIEFNDDQSDHSNDSIITESSNLNVPVDVQVNTLKDSVKPKKSSLKKHDSQLSKPQIKKTTFISPIKQKRKRLPKYGSVFPINANQIEVDSPVKSKKDIPCVISKGALSLINANDNVILSQVCSPKREIKKTKTTEYSIDNEITTIHGDALCYKIAKIEEIPVRNISYSPQAGKWSHQTRMEMIPWVKMKRIIDNDEGIEGYKAYTETFNTVNSFNKQARKLKAKYMSKGYTRVQSMANITNQPANQKFDKHVSKFLLQKIASKSRLNKSKLISKFMIKKNK